MQARSIDTALLDEFVYLAESLSFRLTADHYYVNRSAISRHVVALEEVVGARLLERDSRGVELTEAGRVLYRDAKVVLRDWERALERVHAIGKSEGALVRVGYLRNAARPVIVRFARYMAETHPELRLSLAAMECNDLHRALGDWAVDIAIMVDAGSSNLRSYRSTALYDDRFYAVCAKDHPLAGRKGALRLDDLRGQKLLLPDGYQFVGLSDLADKLAGEKGLLFSQSFFQDLETLYLKVQTEGYVAFSSGLNNAMFGGRLVELPVRDVSTAFSVSAFYHDEFSGRLYRTCCEGLEWCRSDLAARGPDLSFNAID